MNPQHLKLTEITDVVKDLKCRPVITSRRPGGFLGQNELIQENDITKSYSLRPYYKLKKYQEFLKSVVVSDT